MSDPFARGKTWDQWIASVPISLFTRQEQRDADIPKAKEKPKFGVKSDHASG